MDAMRKLLIILATLFISLGIQAQNIPVYEEFEDYQFLLEKNNDTTYVVNYWATYCAPCVKEMPVFRKLEKEYSNKPVKIILTSLDFGSNATERVRSFMNRHDILSEVVILDDPNSNSWIDKVSPQWSGALPATLIYNSNSRELYEQTFTYSELEKIIQSKIQ
jgi:thiol-disulfide isomerase/thioredoxin